MAKPTKQCAFKDRAQWRAWLAEHHANETEIWLIYHKKHTGKSGVAYADAVEEALCFGWIDGLLRRIDDEKYMVRFSPRRKSSVWSEANKARVKKMIASGQMTEVGLAKVTAAKKSGPWDQATRREKDCAVPAELEEALAANAQARKHFEALAPSCRKHFIWWIDSAKRHETRQKRTAEAIDLPSQGKKLGMK